MPPFGRLKNIGKAINNGLFVECSDTYEYVVMIRKYIRT